MNPLLKKLNYKNSEVIAVINSPEEFKHQLEEFGQVTTVGTDITNQESYDFIVVFIKTLVELEQFAESVIQRIAPDGVLWFVYPKKTSKKYKADISRDKGWDKLEANGFYGVRIVAIDEDWSALRFRHQNFIKK